MKALSLPADGTPRVTFGSSFLLEFFMGALLLLSAASGGGATFPALLAAAGSPSCAT